MSVSGYTEVSDQTGPRILLGYDMFNIAFQYDLLALVIVRASCRPLPTTNEKQEKARNTGSRRIIG